MWARVVDSMMVVVFVVITVVTSVVVSDGFDIQMALLLWVTFVIVFVC
jgi:hypothetical protein